MSEDTWRVERVGESSEPSGRAGGKNSALTNKVYTDRLAAEAASGYTRLPRPSTRLSDNVFTAILETLQARCLFANIARLFDFPIHQSMFILQSREIRLVFIMSE